MGIYLSACKHKYNTVNNENIEIKNNICYICRNSINKDELVTCTRCKINLHIACEDTYRHNRNYCMCPKCKEKGTLDGVWAY